MPYAHSDKTLPMMADRAPERREKLEGGKNFVMQTAFSPAGDQPTAIAELSQGVFDGERDQVLLGATGTGKTFTMANVIQKMQRPALVIAPNKTLAAQLFYLALLHMRKLPAKPPVKPLIPVVFGNRQHRDLVGSACGRYLFYGAQAVTWHRKI